MGERLDQSYIDEVVRAASTIEPFVLRTPLIRSEPLSELTGGAVFLKLENLQQTGSFKVRGAAHCLSSLSAEERARGVVTCSSGNHGRAVAFVAQRLEVHATICVPQWVDPVKLTAMRQCGASVDIEGTDYDDAERRAWRFQEEQHLSFVHPFDDRHILAGQGTITLEVLDAQPETDTIVAPLSGGGLIAGIGLGVRARQKKCRVVAISARNANVMAESLEAGKPISLPEEKTIASALSGGIGLDNQHTFRLVRELVDVHDTVDEVAIADAVRFLANEHRLVVEGGGAAAVAGVLANPKPFKDRCTAIVVSGGNIDLSEWIQLVGDDA